MIKNKIILFLAIFTMFGFVSCEDEPVDPDFLVEEPNPCNEPSLFTVSSFINGNTVRIDWDKASGDAWEVQYGINGFVLGTGITVNFTNTSSLISGLSDTISYQFYIRTKCANSKYSAWVGPVSPGSSVTSCALPTNVTAVRFLDDTSMATVAWTVNGDENSWQVEYGNHGFVLGSGTILASLSPTKTISNLIENVSYDFYVRSNCTSNQNSDWVGPITINAVGVVSTDAFYALVDGVEFFEVDINVNPNALHNGLPSINIIATDAFNDVIDINVENDVVVGTEYFNTDPLTDKFKFIYFEPIPIEFETDTDGSIIITERTATRIKGTFSFNAIGPAPTFLIRNVTVGTFDVAIP